VLALSLIVVSIGVVDSLNPGTIAPAFYFATSSRPVRNTLAFGAGILVVNLLAGIVLLFGLARFLIGAVPHPGADTKHLAELVLGACALVGAALLWHMRDRVSERYAQAATRADRASLLVGAAIASIELPTAVPYFAAIAAVAGSSANVPFQLALLSAFNLIFVGPVLLIAASAALSSDRSAARMEHVRTLLIAHAGGLLAGLLMLLAIALLLLAATGFAR
jgi:cytochrome c biogenesis protein CcdA